MPSINNVSFPVCGDAWQWSYNSLGQSPCEVAALLASQCNSSSYTLDPLLPNESYGGIDGVNNPCQCNSVYYSLICACGARQGSTWAGFSDWTYDNCSIIYLLEYPIQNGTRTPVPHWAYLYIVDTWNSTAAEIAGDSPENSPTGFSRGSSVTASGVSQSPISRYLSTTQAVSQSPFSSPSLNVDKLRARQVGTVVGVMVAAILITAILWRFRRRRRRAEEQPSPLLENETHMVEVVDQPDPCFAMPTRYYDPSDPSTFPQPIVSTPIPATLTEPSGENDHGSKSTGTNDRTQYNGLPLV